MRYLMVVGLVWVTGCTKVQKAQKDVPLQPWERIGSGIYRFVDSTIGVACYSRFVEETTCVKLPESRAEQ